jgi:hypothetical protein
MTKRPISDGDDADGWVLPLTLLIVVTAALAWLVLCMRGLGR